MLDQLTQAYYPSDVERRAGVPEGEEDRAAQRQSSLESPLWPGLWPESGPPRINPLPRMIAARSYGFGMVLILRTASLAR